ncbi:MAG: CYTH domain-containing protein [Chloroflexi bacterium]|nr:CYTH domain-containing protein [Chloroflexota bacterium]MDA1219727.1 CYTH domain-containing protein [Chloroflexota bacterium]PKB57365.1 MAG: hypothetical protein BZY73_03625 [SAR202 cluster bacterium Casp-Chloro-G3]
MLEIEATLIICSETPQKVVANVAALSSAGQYALQPRPPASIRDYYLDTTEQILRQANFNLRLREIDQALWLTLKGPPKRLAEGISERLELEIPWSPDSLARIKADLASRDIMLPTIPLTPGSTSPLVALAAAGLETIQQRDNHRQIRNIRDCAIPDNPPLAELSIDSVVYHFGQRPIRHYEVEIEAKSEAGVTALPGLTQGLADQYPSTLRRWGHGKLATGRAIEALLEQGQLDSLLGNDGELMPSAYLEILDHLQYRMS